MSLRVFGHYISQPTRAVLWMLHMKKVPFEFVKVRSGGVD
jgi:glutathione S-transferase